MVIDPVADRQSQQKKVKILLFLLLAGFALFFYKVGDRDLWAPDEDEYAQMSREMIRFNNWAFPTVNGQPWAIKPVLYNWLIALISLPWGDVDEFRARVFSSLAALGTFLATFYLGRRAFSTLAGLLSAAVLGTSVLFLQYARWSQTNMLSTFFMMFAVFLFYRGYTDPVKRRLSYLMMYASVGLGVLTMGPVNLIMPGMVIFFYLIVMQDFKHLKQLRLGWGILIFLTITMPWYVLVSLNEGYGFDLLIRTNISRYFDTWTHAQPFYYYLKDFPWAFAPWSLFLPGALLLAFSKRTRDERPAVKFLLVWIISLFLFFSFSQAKRPQYILAIYPAFALLVGYLGDKAIKFWQEKYFQKMIIIPSLIFLGIIAPATIALPLIAGFFFKPWFIAALGVSIITGSFSALLWLAWRKNQARQLLFLPAVFMLVATLYSVHVLIPKMEYYKSPKPFCEEIVARLDRGGRWAMYQFYRAAYVYYTDSFCTVLKSESELEAYLKQPALSLVVLKEKHYQGLGDSLKKITYVVTKKQIGHRLMVLISNQKPS